MGARATNRRQLYPGALTPAGLTLSRAGVEAPGYNDHSEALRMTVVTHTITRIFNRKWTLGEEAV